MTSVAFHAWLLSIMLTIAPNPEAQLIPEARETRALAEARYDAIARAIADVVLDPREAPLRSYSFTGALLVALTWHESAGWRRDVDLGLARVRLARVGWNDEGRSWCLGQVNLGMRVGVDGEPESVGRTIEGWTGPELIADRRKCIAATLHAVRRSFASCASLPVHERLSAYASGVCDSRDGREKSARRVRLAFRLLAAHPFVLGFGA